MGEKTKLVFEFRQFLCLQKISKNRVIVDKKRTGFAPVLFVYFKVLFFLFLDFFFRFI